LAGGESGLSAGSKDASVPGSTAVQFASTWRVPVEGALARGPAGPPPPSGAAAARGSGDPARGRGSAAAGAPTPDEVADEYAWDDDEAYGEGEENDDDENDDDDDDDASAEELHGDTGQFGDEPDSAGAVGTDAGGDLGGLKKKTSWRFWDKKK
jgi:hypothetical protein